MVASKLFGFRPKSDLERELVERAIHDGKYPSNDAFVREAVLAHIAGGEGPKEVAFQEAIKFLEDQIETLKERMKENGRTGE